MENFFHHEDKNDKTEHRKVSWYMILVIVIILAAILTRFVNLGDRVMSHDEVNHVVPSYDFYTGVGYQHNPVSHGPLQLLRVFHMLLPVWQPFFLFYLHFASILARAVPRSVRSLSSSLLS